MTPRRCGDGNAERMVARGVKPFLPNERIVELHSLLVDTGLCEQRPLLLSGMAPPVSAQLPYPMKNPSAQLMSDLQKLNDMHTNEGPAHLGGFIRNAIQVCPSEVVARRLRRILHEILPTPEPAPRDPRGKSLPSGEFSVILIGVGTADVQGLSASIAEARARAGMTSASASHPLPDEPFLVADGISHGWALEICRDLCMLGASATVLGRGADPRLTRSPHGVAMIHIPAGATTLGSPPGEPGRRNDEQQRDVRLSRPFLLGCFPVTQELYSSVMGKGLNRSRFRQPQRPVEGVSWDEAIEFCARLTMLEGGCQPDYRLPTEAEWEYAARATDGTRYAGSNHWHDVAWAEGLETQPVGQRRPNGWGLYDLSGNVGEWVADTYATDPPGGDDPLLQDDGPLRVVRGGSYQSSRAEVRVAARAFAPRTLRSPTIGFRVARDTASATEP